MTVHAGMTVDAEMTVEAALNRRVTNCSPTAPV
jgi:hypothetical protein